MAEYPTDIKISEDDRNVFLDGTGDLAVIGGKPNLEQSVAILVMDATRQFIGSRVTGSSVGLLEARVREALNDDPQLSKVLSVEVDEFDRSQNKVIMTARTEENETFQFGVSA